ncbi:hypothetical protein GCM10011576_59790 [Micromonospora parathelypteridis]|nr:hypothetical protein GCM10011576_59790 [Micromonospora parathelypteridis]
MLRARVTTNTTDGTSRLKPALRSRAIAQAVSISPEITSTSQAIVHLTRECPDRRGRDESCLHVAGRLGLTGYAHHSSGVATGDRATDADASTGQRSWWIGRAGCR